MKNEKVMMSHGSGGRLMQEMIRDVFFRNFDNEMLNRQTDAAVFPGGYDNYAFTTDSFVIHPVFFPGGDIGKLAVCGTVNDLAVSGATPFYLSASFILEEGFDFGDLEKIVTSMSGEAKKAGVKIVTGDTKVVDKGKCDKIFINTTGIGALDETNKHIGSGRNVETGDLILINGSVGDHGIAVMSARNELNINVQLDSDCASLNNMIASLLQKNIRVKFMRDPTRGGLATVLNELVHNKPFGIEMKESAVPVKENVLGMCEMLGFDPLYVANEGKVVMVIHKEDAEKALEILKQHEYGTESAIIGEIIPDHPGKAWLKTAVGGKRIIDMLSGEQLPRIC